jgi:hypothetical protein
LYEIRSSQLTHLEDLNASCDDYDEDAFTSFSFSELKKDQDQQQQEEELDLLMDVISPASPCYSATSPAFSPSSPSYAPKSPAYSPRSLDSVCSMSEEDAPKPVASKERKNAYDIVESWISDFVLLFFIFFLN